MKLEGCYGDDMSSTLSPTKLPASYTTSMNVGYDLNFIADQDGTVDPNCTRAFINKININEQFGYIECMENSIDFEGFLSALVTSISDSNPVNSILSVIKDVAAGVKINPASITNTSNYKTLDITSGVYNLQKTVKTELFQFQSISLENDQQFIESYEIECAKEPSGFSIKLKAKILTLDVIITKMTGNAPPVSLVATC